MMIFIYFYKRISKLKSKSIMKTKYRFFFSLLCMLAELSIYAQPHQEFVVTLAPQTVTYNRLGVFPNVIFVNPGTAYDENNKRLFFQGRDYSGWTLYTVDVLTGDTIYQINNFTPAAGSTITYMCYDNLTDTLYGLHFYSVNNQTICSFCWIDPSTGTYQVKSAIPNTFPGYYEYAYDELNHRFFFTGVDSNLGNMFYVIDAHTGNIEYSTVLNHSFHYLNFNNVTGHLYALVDSVSWTSTQIDTIDIATGQPHHLYSLPSLPYQVTYRCRTAVMDEPNGHFLFVARTYNQPDSLYTYDLQSNTVIDRKFYSYDPTGTLYAPENILGYCHDRQTNTIYGIHWGISESLSQNIYSFEENSDLSIAPNPTHTQTTIRTIKPCHNAKIAVHNAIGDLVELPIMLQSNSIEIETSHLDSGIYFISINFGDGSTVIKKLIVD
jgi:Secretion system C-terminal sorting domain